ncbi:hypothetical protein NKR23_g3112 [Pleurostoma richardsiae]|uniref:DUF6590 domain-containing protein n=1 Tax=Pleurostoma richardsiae TaxID=41990 RepID=A0AA38RMV4_9PEZI|nr:hypothetical protein NKR23_g3112 [Pleurostoma richardsiae]
MGISSAASRASNRSHRGRDSPVFSAASNYSRPGKSHDSFSGRSPRRGASALQPIPRTQPGVGRISKRGRVPALQIAARRKLSIVNDLKCYGSAASSFRLTDRVYDRDTYVVGLVISAPWHAPAYDQVSLVQIDDPGLTASPVGTIISKFRKFVVVSVGGSSCQMVPIYTHNSRGIVGKPHKDEWLAIRDADDPNSAPRETPYGIMLQAFRDSDFSGTFIKGLAYVHLTETTLHEFNATATIEGKLDDFSLTALKFRVFAMNTVRLELADFFGENPEAQNQNVWTLLRGDRSLVFGEEEEEEEEPKAIIQGKPPGTPEEGEIWEGDGSEDEGEVWEDVWRGK